MKQVTFDLDSVADMIHEGRRLLIAGDEGLLSKLPAGNWIGGTIPYFMAEEGGVYTRDRIFVTELPAYATDMQIRAYDAAGLASVYRDGPQRGFIFVIIPAASDTHMAFACGAPSYEGAMTKPLLGWIAGVQLDDVGAVKPKVFDGRTGRAYSDAAMVAHAGLPDDKVAEVDILNIFAQGDGDEIEFLEDGFSVKQARINGEVRPLASYLKDRNIDTRLPLVTNYGGAMVNVSFQKVDEANGTVLFYAPVFKDLTYRVASVEGDYLQAFRERMPSGHTEAMLFSCNCILNYLYAGLEGSKTGEVTGPITFGEIAFQLLNQTLVYLKVHDV